MTHEEILELVAKYEKEVSSIKTNLLKLCWYMRGGVTYSEALNMTNSERLLINKIVEENIETTKKSGLPFF
jgi:hypothetical protein